MSVDRCWRAAQSVGVEEILTWPAEPRGWAGYYPRTSTNTRGKDLWLGETKPGLHDDLADISISTIPGATDTQGTAVSNDLHAATISNMASPTVMRYDLNNHRRGSTQAPDEFPYFQRLPAEIRNMIWEYSLPEPRVYEVLDAPSSKQKTPAQKGLMFANVHPEPPPALAAVCRESRSFVLHQYKPLTLGSTTKYVDLSRDILLLEPYLLVKRLHRTLHFMSQIPLIRDNINQLALGTSYGIYPGIFHPVLSWKVSKTNMSKLLSSLSKFPRLNTLVFIVHQEFQFEFDCRFPGTMTPIPNNSLLPPSLQSHASATTGAGAVATGYPSPASGGSPVATLSPLPSRPPAASSSSAVAHPLSPMSSSNRSIASSPIPSSYLSPAVSSSPESGQQPHQQYRPQLIHQAYRFKFDIEANINHTPRRPHHNEFQYYPLEIDQEKDDWDLGEIGEEGEWCDPRPTNDDWRRFRKRFMWAMDKSLEMEAASLAQASSSEAEENIKGATPAKQCYQPGRVGEKRKGEPLEKEWEKSKKKRLELPKLKLKGASLLWRYTNNRGAYA